MKGCEFILGWFGCLFLVVFQITWLWFSSCLGGLWALHCHLRKCPEDGFKSLQFSPPRVSVTLPA